MDKTSINIGWIPYWNLLPLHYEILRASNGQLNLMAGHPSAVNRWLMDGDVRIAPASSITLMKSKSLEMAFPVGIASDGPVQSVFIGLHRDHEEFFGFVRSRQARIQEVMSQFRGSYSDNSRLIATGIWNALKDDHSQISLPALRLTSASAASAALARVMLNLWLGSDSAAQLLALSTLNVPDPLNGDFRTGPMELIIGDEALIRRHEFWKIIDLGQVWHEMTGLPFVFGLWQTTSMEQASSLKSLVVDAATLAQTRMRVEPHTYFPERLPMTGDGKVVDLSSYWQVIQYKLTDRHMRSMLLYFALYQQICGMNDDLVCSERLMRWSKTWL